MKTTILTAVIALAASAAAPAQEHKELGRMWTFENAPLDWFEHAYGFRPTQDWLDALRAASLRYGNGCSASFVSPRGLIITNNHCAQENVGEVSPADQDWVVDGYFAASLEAEVPVPGLSVQQLIATNDVTELMNAGLEDGMSAAERQAKLRENRIAIIDAAKKKQPDLSQELVTLYQGGMYQLYSYKVFSDVRIVCAPPKSIAEFGGDPDNFTYPRFCLDFALCRAYEDGEPADTSAHYLRFKTEGPSEGDTVFVSGNPGSTGRLDTLAQMEFLRDVRYPRTLKGIAGRIDQIEKAMADDSEAAKEMRPMLLQMENGRKAYSGYLDGLLNPETMAIKRLAEQRLRAIVAANPELNAKFGDAWTKLEEIVAKKRDGGRNTQETLQEEQALVKRIGEAAFAVYGTSIPPDATFSLRISDGVVKGYDYNGTIAPWTTTLYGLYGRHANFAGETPFDLPEEWAKAGTTLDLKTKFNFVTTCDIIGGNSGSPLVNTDGEFVGLAFDGNIESLGNRFVFKDDVERTVCVHPEIIIAALRDIYDRGALADELEGK